MSTQTPPDPRPETSHPTLAQLMTVSEKAAPADARTNNRMMVFSLLFPRQTLSRADIGRRTGLSKVSVSEVVYDLLEKHVLVEVGREERNRPGKRGTLLNVDTSHWNIISVDLSQPHLIQGAITNLVGLVLDRAEQPVEDAGQITPDFVETFCERLIRMAGEAVLGIGIAISGIVTEEGVVTKSSNLQWSDVDLRDLIEQRFGLPTFIDNDANSALLAERFFGHGTPNSIFVQIALGVGAAVLIDDAMVLGTSHAAGEIGHVVVDPNGPECVCGKRGCLEAIISPANIRKHIDATDGTTAQTLSKAGKYLGNALAMPVSLLDLNDVVVYGPVDIVNETFLQSTQDALNSGTASDYHQPARVRRCECGNDIVMRGESISVLQSMLSQL